MTVSRAGRHVMGAVSKVVRASAAVAVVAAGVAAAGPAASAAAAPECGASGLSAKVTGTAAGMSQPVTFVTVTNTGSQACYVKGYPNIDKVKSKARKVSFTVTKGGVQNAPQVKVSKVVLQPGGKAWFAIGTATAYDPPIVNLTKVVFSIDGEATPSTVLKVKIAQQATAPSGKPVPINVTPFAKGIGTGAE